MPNVWNKKETMTPTSHDFCCGQETWSEVAVIGQQLLRSASSGQNKLTAVIVLDPSTLVCDCTCYMCVIQSKKHKMIEVLGICWGEKQWFLYVTFSRADTYEHARWCKGWSGGFFLRWIMNHESRDASFPEVQVAAKARSLLFYMTNCS